MSRIKNLLIITFILAAFTSCGNNNQVGSEEDQASLKKTTAAIRDAFARADVPAILEFHHPDVFKYFGGHNVVKGKEGLTKQLTEMFRDSKIEFFENTIESTIFNGQTAIETGIFAIKATPKNGGVPTIFRGRSMVVYVRYRDSPTGWASIREMVQDAPSH